jgi:cell wall-associated NlpC family hydrolase
VARLTVGVVAVILVVLVLASASVTAVLGQDGAAWACADSATGSVTSPASTSEAPTSTGALTREQTVNAAIIIDEARRLELPRRAAVIAVATALQESGLRNLDHGHADSLGLFQQRPSQGWGDAPAGPGDQRTPSQRITDPRYAATAFYRALTAVPDWQSLSLTVAAQAVQRSAYPDAYARWEPLATRTVNALPAQPCPEAATSSAPGPAAATAVAYARAQLGVPYLWAGDGPGQGEAGFDCSGLTHAAYDAAGIAIPRTAQTQYNAGPHLAPGTPLRQGDLVFFGTGPSSVTHVGIVITASSEAASNEPGTDGRAFDGWMIDAPRKGAVVRVERIWKNVVGATRPSAS